MQIYWRKFHTPCIVLYSCLLAKCMYTTLLIEPTHWIEAIAPFKFVMLRHTQSQVCQCKTWPAVASLTLLRDSKYPWAKVIILRLWRVYNVMLQYKIQVHSITNTIFEPKANRDGKLGVHMQYEFDILQPKISLILQVGLIKEMKCSYWIQERKMMQNNIQEPTGIWDQRHIKGLSPDCTPWHTAIQNALLQNQCCNLWTCLRPAYISKHGKNG